MEDVVTKVTGDLSARAEISGVRQRHELPVAKPCAVEINTRRIACLDRDGKGECFYAISRVEVTGADGLPASESRVLGRAEYTDDAGRIIRIEAEQPCVDIDSAALLLGWMLDLEWTR